MDVADRDALSTWVAEAEKGVIAAPIADQAAPVTAQTRSLKLTCLTTDLKGLTTFRDSWFKSVGVHQ